jgi:hypothetical protein
VVLLIANAVICGMAILDETEIYWYLVWQLLDGWQWLHRQRPGYGAQRRAMTPPRITPRTRARPTAAKGF